MKFLWSLLITSLIMVFIGLGFGIDIFSTEKPNSNNSVQANPESKPYIPSTTSLVAPEQAIKDTNPPKVEVPSDNSKDTTNSEEITPDNKPEKESNVQNDIEVNQEGTKGDETKEPSEQTEPNHTTRTFDVGNEIYIEDIYKWTFQGFLDSDTFVIAKEYNSPDAIKASNVFYITIDETKKFSIPATNVILTISETLPNSIVLLDRMENSE